MDDGRRSVDTGPVGSCGQQSGCRSGQVTSEERRSEGMDRCIQANQKPVLHVFKSMRPLQANMTTTHTQFFLEVSIQRGCGSDAVQHIVQDDGILALEHHRPQNAQASTTKIGHGETDTRVSVNGGDNQGGAPEPRCVHNIVLAKPSQHCYMNTWLLS